MMLITAKRPVVLIVEDEFLLRMNAVEMIKEAGFEVVEASNADVRLRYWKAAPIFVSFLLTSRCQAQWMA
jgi:DNA-binding response OmpR family regulator